MGPKVRFTRQQIVEAAFEIARTEGLDKVTTRKVAETMGSSVAPIYVNFAGRDELLEALLERIISLGQQLMREEDTGHPFEDMGRASLRFAMEYSLLFRDLVINGHASMNRYDEKMVPELIAMMQEDPGLQGFSDEALETMLFKMRVFQLGLSVMAAGGMLPDNYGINELNGILASAAADVIRSARMGKDQEG